MKYIIPVIGILSVLVFFFSCAYKNTQQEPSRLDDSSGITYIKDSQTNLCFAIMYGTPGYAMSRPLSMTCVPCDSLNNIK